ncbi:MAG: hypothetical protein XD78_1781 [Desulfotomaculum sp. 46_296]|nr:MAG: hypothetical protein XD78_1781 [Desulfotomaculum sp. 46_296]
MVFLQTDEVLEIGIFGDLLDRLPVVKTASFFDDQGAQCYTQWLCYHTGTGRQKIGNTRLSPGIVNYVNNLL